MYIHVIEIDRTSIRLLTRRSSGSKGHLPKYNHRCGSCCRHSTADEPRLAASSNGARATRRYAYSCSVACDMRTGESLGCAWYQNVVLYRRADCALGAYFVCCRTVRAARSFACIFRSTHFDSFSATMVAKRCLHCGSMSIPVSSIGKGGEEITII